MPQSDADIETRPLEGKTILLAEDEERLRTIMAMMIEELGAHVISVADGQGALDAYKAGDVAIDLVILDMRMSGLSGAGTFRQLLSYDPGVKVVLSSGVLPDDDLVDMLLENRGGFIEKPFNLDRLCEVLRLVLSGEPVIQRL